MSANPASTVPPTPDGPGRGETLQFVELVRGDVKHRGTVIALKDLPKVAGEAEVYASIFRQSAAWADHVGKTRSVKGAPRGPVGSEVLPFDIDHENLQVALESTRKLLVALDALGADTGCVRVAFSGAKGFHVLVPGACFGGLQPTVSLPEVLKKLAGSIAPPDVQVNSSIYDRHRIFRVLNTRNAKSGLFKIPLTPEELGKLTLAEIQDLARAPRTVTVVPLDDAVAAPDLVELYRKASGSPAAENTRSPASPQPWLTRAVNGAGKGTRHDTILRLVASAVSKGMSDEEVLLQARGAASNFDSPWSNSEFQSEFDSALLSARDKFGNAKAGSEEGPEVPLDEIPWPSPPGPKAFHGLAGRIVDAVSPHSEADPVALLLQLLTGFGCLVGSGPHVAVEGSKHGARLFVAMVGQTSKARKGTSWGVVRGVLDLVDREWLKSHVAHGLSSGEGLIWAVRDPISKKEPVKKAGRVVEYQEVQVDEGVKDKRLMVLEEEFARVLRVLLREGNTLSATLRCAWDSGDLRTLTKNSPATATGGHISLVAHITKQELLRHLDDNEAGNGFGNRFLWACIKRSKCLPEGGRLPEATRRSLGRDLLASADFARRLGEVHRDPEARQLWAERYPDLSEGKPGLLGAMTARGEAQTLRLSLIFALLDKSPEIRVEHLEAALEVWRFCEDSAGFIFGSALGDPVADEIFRALRASAEGLTRTQLRDLFDRNKDTKEIVRGLRVLLEYGLIVRLQASTGGRPAEVYRVASATTNTTEGGRP